MMEKKLQIGNKGFLKDEHGFLVMVPAEASQIHHVPLECPICKFLMRDYTDVIAYQKWECCDDCYIAWAEINQDKWQEGWRPSEEEIEHVRKKRLSAPSYRVR